MLRRIRDLRDKAPEPPPSAEEVAGWYRDICREVIALINDNKLVDGPNGFTAANGLSDFWQVFRCRDNFLIFVASWWWNTGMGQRPAGSLNTHEAYELASEIAMTIEQNLQEI